MHMKFDELWMDALDMRVSEQIVIYLKDYHQEYRDTSRRQRELLEQYPVLDGDGTVTLNADEHCAFKEYLVNRDDMEQLEREYFYYYGQSHVFSYGHNMKSGAMFGTLEKFAALSYCREHPSVLFQTVDGIYFHTIAAVLMADMSMFPFQQTAFQEPPFGIALIRT